MFFGIDLNQTFSFPFKDAESRKHFLIGCLVSLTAFIIPILPFFFLYGYAIRIVKQIMNNETPRMVAWDDWGGMFMDGARMFGVRIIYSIPIMILTAPLFISSIVMPILMGNSNSSEMDALFPILMVIMFCTFCFLIPISFLLAIVIPAAEMHVVDKDEFAAGFRIGEWWKIFRANISGFIAAFAVYLVSAIILGFAVQLIWVTLIFACLMPILMPAITIYILLIMYTTIAQAYKVGKEKLALVEIVPVVVAE
jgi:Protein of unknown function (DUF4013)